MLNPEYPNFEKKTLDDQKKMILQIEEAKIEDGGSGAFYIYLKKLK